MKYCPACRSQYSDVTLRFCLQDGAVLQDDGEAKQSTIETVAFSDPVTAGNILKTEDLNLYAPKKESGSKTRAWSPEPPKSARRQGSKKNGSSAKSWLAVCGVLVALGVAGAGGWFYLQNQNNSPVQAANPAEASTPANNSASKAVLDDLSAQTNSNSEPSNSSSGSEDAKKEIA